MKFIIDSIIPKYYAIDQQLALLMPLLEDEELYRSWDNTVGAHGVEALRMSLYMSILSDIRALIFDPDRKTASLKTVAAAFSDRNYCAALRKGFCQQIELLDTDIDIDDETRKWVVNKRAESKLFQFNHLAPRITSRFKELETSELVCRIDSARSKMISHRQLKTTNGERDLYNPSHFGLTWGDAYEIVTTAKELIFDINLLINNSSYGDKRYKNHRDIANSFWSRVKRG